MLGSPPEPQPLTLSTVARATIAKRIFLKVDGRRLLQNKNRAGRSRLRKARLRGGVGAFCEERLTEVMVLMVAVEFWAVPLRVMLEGMSEQVALGPGVIGVQLRMTVPAKAFCGVTVRV